LTSAKSIKKGRPGFLRGGLFNKYKSELCFYAATTAPLSFKSNSAPSRPASRRYFPAGAGRLLGGSFFGAALPLFLKVTTEDGGVLGGELEGRVLAAEVSLKINVLGFHNFIF
jgi:hypothetical protein